MEADEFAALVRQRLRETNKTKHRAALDVGLRQDAIRSVLKGHAPSINKVHRVCAALGLEFYIGPPRDPGKRPPLRPSSPPPTWPDLTNHLIEATELAQKLRRQEGVPPELEQKATLVLVAILGLLQGVGVDRRPEPPP